ncbi:MAG: nucleoside-diphosphate sugar epimerase [Flavobacteriaceae bacterium]|nr:nucleoside-diphosphate sugar epimerase [Flavobacteriaceae bacterium]
MGKTAIVLGATGLVGGHVVRQLIRDSDVERIKIFGRNAAGINHPKVEEFLLDLFQLETYAQKFTGDVVFCCVGTTKAKTPDKETYRRIDYGIPVTAAQLAAANDIETFVVVSSLGANVSSSIFYNRTKGEMERDVLTIQIPRTYVVQPSLIGGNRSEKRTGERLAQRFSEIFGFLLPRKYKMIHAETIAKAMLKLWKTGAATGRIPSHELKRIAEE